ncbi:MAG: hypothetical protein WD336_06580, partial [Trueperaceae bacterium]
MPEMRSPQESPQDRFVLVTPRAPRASLVPAGARVLTSDPAVAKALRRPFASPAGEAGRDLTRAGLEVAPPLVRWRALGDAVRAELHAELHEDDANAWRRALRAPLREIVRSGLDPGSLPDGLSEATVRAVGVAAAYRRALRERGAIDPAELYRAAVDAGPERRVRPWAVMALPRLDGGLAAWLDRVAAPGTVVVLPPEARDAIDLLHRLGWPLRDDPEPVRRSGERWASRFLNGAPDGPGPTVLRFPSQDEQLRWATAATADALREGVPPDRIAWLARDPARVADAVDAVAWEGGVAVRAEVDETLADTAVGAVLSLLAEVVQRDAPFEATVRLLRHRTVRPLSDAAFAEARRRRPGGVRAWERFDDRASAWSWPRRAPRSEFLVHLRSALEALLRPDDQLSALDRAARRAAEEALAELGRPGGAEASRGAFLDDLRDLLRLAPAATDVLTDAPTDGAEEATAPHEGDPPAVVEVPVLSFEAAAGRRLQRAIVLDLTEGTVPAPVRDDPVLDFADRSRLGRAGATLDDAAARARHEEAAFAGALRAIDGPAWCCVPAGSDGGTLLPSPFVERLRADPPGPPPARVPIGIEERRG